jgi:hypothetical protein
MSLMGIEVIGSGNIGDTYDMFLGTLGYESRSTHLARNKLFHAKRNVALAFPEEDYASYLKNRDFLTGAGFEIVPNTPKSIGDVLEAAFASPADDGRFFSLLIDISSMSRPMLASLIYILSNMKRDRGIASTFVYLPAAFVKGSAEHPPVAVSEPVTPEYAGWTAAPELPISAVVGLGYEHDLALGALEYLEPTAAWVFVPTGEDRRYDDAVKEANRNLGAMFSADRSMTYLVDRPMRVHAMLETLVYGLLQNSRPILIPFGPKIFSLCCMLVACNYAPDVTVWRVSGETLSRPGDREASGKIVTLKADFVPKPQDDPSTESHRSAA